MELVYSWQYIGLTEKMSDLERWVFSTSFFMATVFLGVIFGFDAIKPLLPIVIVMIFLCRYLFSPDSEVNYYFTEYGLYYDSTQLIPESAYKTVRVIAWVGIALSLVAVFIVGIGALAGAGASALMGFKLTGFKSETERLEFLFCERAIVFDIDNKSPIKVKYKDFNERYMVELVSEGCKDKSCSTALYFNDEEKKREVIQELSKLFSEFEVVKVATVNDYIEHEKYQEILDSRPG